MLVKNVSKKKTTRKAFGSFELNVKNVNFVCS